MNHWDVKYGMEIDHKHTHKFCMKHSICVNSYKHCYGAKLWDYAWQI